MNWELLKVIAILYEPLFIPPTDEKSAMTQDCLFDYPIYIQVGNYLRRS